MIYLVCAIVVHCDGRGALVATDNGRVELVATENGRVELPLDRKRRGENGLRSPLHTTTYISTLLHG